VSQVSPSVQASQLSIQSKHESESASDQVALGHVVQVSVSRKYMAKQLSQVVIESQTSQPVPQLEQLLDPSSEY